MNLSFLEKIIEERAKHEYDPVNFSRVEIDEVSHIANCEWVYRAIVVGPKIFVIERWLNDNYDEDDFHVAPGVNGTRIYFNNETIAMNLKLTWTIG